MELEKVCENLESRIQKLEGNQTILFDRMGKVEDKTDSAWHTLRETKTEITGLRKEVDELKTDVKQMKSEQESMAKLLKILIVMVAFLGVICVGFFVYIWRHDAELAQSILTLGGAVSKAIPLAL